jgi:hypothetical protein
VLAEASAANVDVMRARDRRDVDVHARAPRRHAGGDRLERDGDAAGMTSCLTLDNATSNPITGGAVSVGAKPIMLVP